MRVVLDTNVLISAVLVKSGNPVQIIKMWQAGLFDLLLSPAIYEEIERVFTYPKIQKRLQAQPDRVPGLLELLRTNGIWVEPTVQLKAVKNDESDNRQLETAVAGKADYLITGDDHLLTLGTYAGIGIVTPATFVLLFEVHDSE